MMANAFDQFDNSTQSKTQSNPFDKFDLKDKSITDSKPQGHILDYVAEPALTAVTGLANAAASGYGGLGTLIAGGSSEEADRAVKSIQQGGAYQPKTQRGQKGLEVLGNVMEKAGELANYPVSGLAGLAKLIETGDLQQASQLIKQIQQQGAGEVAGGKVLEATGSPGLATLTEMVPDIAGVVVGGANIPRALKAVTGSANKDLIKDGLPTRSFENALKKQGIKFEEVQGSLDKFNLENLEPQEAAQKIVTEQLLNKDKSGYLFDKRIDDFGRVKDDSLAKEALKQGVRKGDIQSIKVSNRETKDKMMDMLRRRMNIANNEAEALKTVPADVIGETFTPRLEYIQQRSLKARDELDNIAKNELKGLPIDTDRIADTFFTELDKLGVSIDDSQMPFKLSFTGSDISKDRASQRFIKDTMDLLSEPLAPDALRAHKLKRQLDSLIDWNKKEKGGLSESGRRLSKNIRYNLNQVIRDVHPEYGQVNDVLSESIGALNDFSKTIKKDFDLASPTAAKRIGNEARILLSRYGKKYNLDEAIKNIDALAKKQGGKFKEDLDALLIFDKTLQDQFGSSLRGSFTAEVASGGKEGLKSMAGGKAGFAKHIFDKGVDVAADKFMNINDTQAYKTLYQLLKRED